MSDARDWVVKAVYQKAPPHKYYRRPDGVLVAFNNEGKCVLVYRECRLDGYPFMTLLGGAFVYEGWKRITKTEFETRWSELYQKHYGRPYRRVRV